MKLVFAATRGYIDLSTPLHRRHSSLLVQYAGRTVLVDCGEDWLGHLDKLGSPDAIVITHAHPDHEAAAGFVEASGKALGIEASIAIDGLVMTVRS